MSDAYQAFQDGLALLGEGRLHEAIPHLEQARDLEPEKGSIREALARSYFRTRQVSRARAEFQKALEIDPANDYAHYGVGRCLLHAGDRVGARRHLKMAVAMRPESEDYRSALVRAWG